MQHFIRFNRSHEVRGYKPYSGNTKGPVGQRCEGKREVVVSLILNTYMTYCTVHFFNRRVELTVKVIPVIIRKPMGVLTPSLSQRMGGHTVNSRLSSRDTLSKRGSTNKYTISKSSGHLFPNCRVRGLSLRTQFSYRNRERSTNCNPFNKLKDHELKKSRYFVLIIGLDGVFIQHF